MTALDVFVLLVVGLSALSGFSRGFIYEILSLSAWIIAVIAIRYFHTMVTGWLEPLVGSSSGAAVLAVLLIITATFVLLRFIARKIGETSRKSKLGPFDRVLGFGFGFIKGSLVVVIAFSILVLGYDAVWGVAGRPAWIVDAHSYQLVNAGSEALVEMISDQQDMIRAGAQRVIGPPS